MRERIPAQKKRTKWVRVGLSAFLTFHLCCLILSQNKQSYLAYRFAGILEPYTNLFELGTAWSFFSPEPGPPMYVEWELLDEKGQALQRGQEPQLINPYRVPERQNRRIAMAYIMAASDEKADQLMAPYLCKHHREAHSVNLWRIVNPVPSITEVAAGTRKPNDEKGLDRKFVSHTFCEGRAS